METAFHASLLPWDGVADFGIPWFVAVSLISLFLSSCDLLLGCLHMALFSVGVRFSSYEVTRHWI